MLIERNVSTKQDESSAAKVTVLKVGFPDGTPMWLANGYMAYLIIKLQSAWRKKGIPSRFECNAQDHAPGTKVQMTPEQALAALSPEERKALLAKYAAELEADE